jgi:anti-sigma factor RsiW
MTQHLLTDTIIDYIHGELPAAEDALVHAHLQSCGPCRSEYEQESALTDALRSAVQADDRELPGMVKARIWEAIRSERPPLSARITALLRPAIAVPAAAVLLAVTYFASPLGHPQQPNARTVDVMYYFAQHAAEEMQSPLGERNVSSAMFEPSDAASGTASTGSRTAAAAVDAVE